MVYNQLLPNGINDEKIIDLVLKIPRHKFITSKYRNIAYIDSILPLWDTDLSMNDNRFIMPSFVLIKMLQEAEINSNSEVLDFSCNTGYSSVIISGLAKKITAVDADRKLLKIAMSQELLSQAKKNITFQLLDHFKKNSEGFRFNVVFINGIMNNIPEYIKSTLIEGGKILVIEKNNHLAKIVKWIKHNNNFFKDEIIAVDADERLLVERHQVNEEMSNKTMTNIVKLK